MQQTTNYNLNKFDATDIIEDDSRLAFNNNFDIIDAALKDASENGGIAVQDTEPTNAVLAWVDSDQLGADFCFVGDTEPTNDGSVAVWVDTQNKAIKTLVGGVWTNVYDTATTTTAGLMSAEDKEKLADIDTLLQTSVDYVRMTGFNRDSVLTKWGKFVQFTNTADITSMASGSVSLGTIPEGYRPAATTYAWGQTGSALAQKQFEFASNGNISCYNYGSAVSSATTCRIVTFWVVP